MESPLRGHSEACSSHSTRVLYSYSTCESLGLLFPGLFHKTAEFQPDSATCIWKAWGWGWDWILPTDGGCALGLCTVALVTEPGVNGQVADL